MPATDSFQFGDVVPMPTLPKKYPVPLSRKLARVVEAELVSSKRREVPVPEPQTDNLLYGVVVPMDTLLF